MAQWTTIKAVAVKCDKSIEYVRTLVRFNQIEAQKDAGGEWHVNLSAAQEYFATHESATKRADGRTMFIVALTDTERQKLLMLGIGADLRSQYDAAKAAARRERSKAKAAVEMAHLKDGNNNQ